MRKMITIFKIKQKSFEGLFYDRKLCAVGTAPKRKPDGLAERTREEPDDNSDVGMT